MTICKTCYVPRLAHQPQGVCCDLGCLTLPYVLDSCSFKRVDLQHVHEESGNGPVEVFGDVKYASTDLLKERGYVFIIKWESAAEKSIENHAAAPDIHLRASVQPKPSEGNREDFISPLYLLPSVSQVSPTCSVVQGRGHPCSRVVKCFMASPCTLTPAVESTGCDCFVLMLLQMILKG